jgi:NTE family protein
VVEGQPHLDTLAFQVDLWSSRGELPRTLVEVSTRQKEIQYSSRTRASTDSFKRIQRLRRITADLLYKLPEELGRCSEVCSRLHDTSRERRGGLADTWTAIAYIVS